MWQNDSVFRQHDLKDVFSITTISVTLISTFSVYDINDRTLGVSWRHGISYVWLIPLCCWQTVCVDNLVPRSLNYCLDDMSWLELGLCRQFHTCLILLNDIRFHVEPTSEVSDFMSYFTAIVYQRANGHVSFIHENNEHVFSVTH